MARRHFQSSNSVCRCGCTWYSIAHVQHRLPRLPPMLPHHGTACEPQPFLCWCLASQCKLHLPSQQLPLHLSVVSWVQELPAPHPCPCPLPPHPCWPLSGWRCSSRHSPHACFLWARCRQVLPLVSALRLGLHVHGNACARVCAWPTVSQPPAIASHVAIADATYMFAHAAPPQRLMQRLRRATVQLHMPSACSSSAAFVSSASQRADAGPLQEQLCAHSAPAASALRAQHAGSTRAATWWRQPRSPPCLARWRGALYPAARPCILRVSSLVASCVVLWLSTMLCWRGWLSVAA